MTGEKAPAKKKFSKLGELKKPIIISSFIAAFAISGIIGGIYLLREDEQIQEKDTLILGLYWGPQSFDPLLCPPIAIENLYLFDAEGLFDFDNLNKTNQFVLNLAESFEWSDDALNFTCTLRQGISFHDGTPFNATAVKFTIDRVYRLLPQASWWIPQLWFLPDSMTPIVNETIVLGDYTVRFVLNQPFVPFQTLLFHHSSYILSPSSTPPNRLINFNNETLVGTGPFMIDDFVFDYNTTLIANPNYWEGEPEIDEIIFKSFWGNHTARQDALLSGNVSFIFGDSDPELQDTFRDAGINVLSLISSSQWYIGMNFERVNATMRRAISYAFNYTHYNEKIHNNPNIRLKSYIPFSFLYSNWTGFDVPEYNISRARQILKDANLTGTVGLTVDDDISPGNEWETKANSSSPLVTYNTSLPYDSWGLNNTSSLIAENLKQIGIKVELINSSREQYYIWAENGEIDFYAFGYFPDYNDPSNILNPQLSNSSDLNWNGYNDPFVQQLLEEGLEETDLIIRKQTYHDLQKYLLEVSCPFLLLCTDTVFHYWHPSVLGVLSAYKSEFSFLLKKLYLN